MAKQLISRPSHSGRRYFSFCASVAQWSSVCMLPSSGAWQFRTNGPKPDLAASACTIASSTWPNPIPPNSSGMWGSQRPASFASRLDPVEAADLLLARLDDRVDEVADAQAEGVQLGGEGEVDRHGSASCDDGMGAGEQPEGDGVEQVADRLRGLAGGGPGVG